ncbi:hypothetical protein [Spirosoma luteum]|uniref:hypothetical protein n=1 Tax=Spirosoma luteum TaxID=431553 RepID=UPI000367D2C2|nr:hypothetical protein [Spirosoma luteum]
MYTSWGPDQSDFFARLRGENGQSIAFEVVNESIPTIAPGPYALTLGDGLQDDEFNTSSFVKFPPGELRFDGVNKLIAFLSSPFTLPLFENLRNNSGDFFADPDRLLYPDEAECR